MLRADDYTRESHEAILAEGEFAFAVTQDAFDTDFWPEDNSAFSSNDKEAEFLRFLGIGKPYVAKLRARADISGATLEAELLADAVIQEDAYYGAIARLLRLPFEQNVDPKLVICTDDLDLQLLEPTMLRLSFPNSPPLIALAPRLHSIADLQTWLAKKPDLAKLLIVTTPSALKRAAWTAGEDQRIQKTVHALFDRRPDYSARIIFHGTQGFCTGTALTMFLTSLLLAPEITLLLIHIVISGLYFAALMLRLCALAHRRTQHPRPPSDPAEAQLPLYTVMVALYHEEAIAEQLVKALDRLDWPRSRLDIKLICEADDLATISALERHLPGPHFEIVRVPMATPRTKPKALTYALSGARGEFVAIYDAEDRPHPQQLRDAYAEFRAAPDKVICLQAPLIISNAKASWISAMFSLEYSALFRRMLPMLAHHHMPLPLGGTSNHFRTRELRAIGAWDPYNVTEDADLGMRLYRLGYRSQVISRHTLEDAPTDLSVWLAQRTRWYKGWLQSWLVMMRHPLKTAREMGWRAYLIFQLLIGGMLLSSLAHPLIFVYAAVTITTLTITGLANVPALTLGLFVIDTCNIFGSYATFLAMANSAMVPYEKQLVGKRWLATPVYWAMLSLAAWRAIIELRYRPFVWNKTPHTPTTSTSVKTK